jgi:GNAT superfamily N-acetyltransferase
MMPQKSLDRTKNGTLVLPKKNHFLDHAAHGLRSFLYRYTNSAEQILSSAYAPKYENVEYAINPSCDTDRWNVQGHAYDLFHGNALVAQYSFTINRRNKSAYFAHIEVEEPYRGRRFAQELIANALTFCYEHGINKIGVTAIKDGLLVWPRYGFSPDPGNTVFYNKMRRHYQDFMGKPCPENMTIPKRGPEIVAYVAPYNRDEYPDDTPRKARIGVLTLEDYQAHKRPKFPRFFEGFEMSLDLRDPITLAYLRDEKKVLGVRLDRQLGVLARNNLSASLP